MPPRDRPSQGMRDRILFGEGRFDALHLPMFLDSGAGGRRKRPGVRRRRGALSAGSSWLTRGRFVRTTGNTPVPWDLMKDAGR